MLSVIICFKLLLLWFTLLKSCQSLLPPSFAMYQNLLNHYRDDGRVIDDFDYGISDEHGCRFFAVFGQIFNESIFKKVQELYPDEEHHHTEIKTYLSFPSWLVLNETSLYLKGIPLQSRMDRKVYFSITISKHEVVVKRFFCLVDIVDTVRPRSEPTSLSESMPGHNCFTLFVVKFDLDQNLLLPKRRLFWMQHLQNFVSSLSRKERSLTLGIDGVVLESKDLPGQGGKDEAILYQAGVEVSWLIDDGSIAEGVNETVLFKEAVDDGSLSKVAKCDVIEWRVENVTSPPSRFKRETFYQRQNDVKYSRSPTTQTLNKILINKYPGIAFDPIKFIGVPMKEFPKREDNRTPFVSGKFRITSEDMDPRKSEEMSSSNIERTQHHLMEDTDSSSGVAHLQKPNQSFTRNPTRAIHVYNMTYFELSLDDLNISSIVKNSTRPAILPAFNYSISEYSLEYDQRKNFFSGLFMGKTFSREMNGFKFRLKFFNNHEPKFEIFKIFLLPRPKPSNHRFTVFLVKQDEADVDANFIRRFAELLVKVLNAKHKTITKTPGKISFLKVLERKAQISVTWFYNRLDSEESCDIAGISALWGKLIGSFPKKLTNETLPPGTNLKKSLEPFFKVKKVKLALLGPCNMKKKLNDIEALRPPLIIPPFPNYLLTIPDFRVATTILSTLLNLNLNFISEATTHAKQPPDNIRLTPSPHSPLYSLEISAFVGIINIFPVDQFFMLKKSSEKFENFQLKSNTGEIPSWIGIEGKELILLPSLDDAKRLSAHNFTHKIWKGELFAANLNKNEITQRFVKVYVNITSYLNLENNPASMIYQMKISNYNIQNFTIFSARRLVKTLQELYDDVNTNKIFIQPFRGSPVLFSWHNTSMTCSNRELNEAVLLDQSNLLLPSAKKRFFQAGFYVSSINLLECNCCLTATSRNAFNSAMVKRSTTAGFQNMVQPTNKARLVYLLVITGVFFCLVVILIIVLVKYWRLKQQSEHRTANNIEDNKKENKARQNLIYRNNGNSIIFVGGIEKQLTHSLLNTNENTNNRFATTNQKEQTLEENEGGRPFPPPYIARTLT